jgi:hypothetical protein
MRPGLWLWLVLASVALGSPAIAAGNVDYSCSMRTSGRVELTRLDGGPPLLIPQSDLMHFFPDRAARMSVSGMAILTCERMPEGLDCTVQDEAPSDMNFGARSLMITRLFPRYLSTAFVRVDFTVLSPDSCSDPLFNAPTQLHQR